MYIRKTYICKQSKSYELEIAFGQICNSGIFVMGTIGECVWVSPYQNTRATDTYSAKTNTTDNLHNTVRLGHHHSLSLFHSFDLETIKTWQRTGKKVTRFYKCCGEEKGPLWEGRLEIEERQSCFDGRL